MRILNVVGTVGTMGVILGRLAVLFLLLFVLACGSTRDGASDSSSRDSTQYSGSEISAINAASNIGKRTTVCGRVVDTRHATTSNGKPTFLNYDKPYPNHAFVVVIWGSDRSEFPSNPESHYRNKTVCANGLIESYQGKPQIVARSSSQLSVR